VNDTLTDYAFYLNIRHLENYRYSNLYVFMHTTFPNGNVTHDTIECILAMPDGRWMGKGSGTMRSANVLLNPALRFPLSGEYHFEIEQAMREKELRGITDIGLCFEKQ
ncbi:MAG: gliding motility lipoprotein GldH, partial [Bacteroidales bacterium]|nr:gliding motility lipoprotein GldH [Bacteroidales bacterium]